MDINDVRATAEQGRKIIGDVIENGLNLTTEQALHEYTAPLDVVSQYAIDERCTNSPILRDLITLNLTIITARVAMVFDMRNKIDGISVVDHIKSARLGINNNKSLFKRIFGLSSIDVVDGVIAEDSVDKLIQLGSYDNIETENVTSEDISQFGNEASDGKTLEEKLEEQRALREDRERDENEKFRKERAINNTPMGVDARNLLSDKFNDIANYACGTNFNVHISSMNSKSEHSASVLMTARIAPVGVRSDVIKEILAIGSYRNSLVERYYSLKAGDIDLWQFVSLNDIVDKQVAILLKDKSGYYRDVLRQQERRRREGWLSIVYGEKIERAKTIGGIILDAETLAEAELLLGGTLDDPTLRNQVFLVTSAATISVIDNNWETVKVYYRGIDYIETYGFNQIKRGSKGSLTAEDVIGAIRRGGVPKI